MFLGTQCCELKVIHKKRRHHFIFWQILTICTSFSEKGPTILILYSKYKSDHCSSVGIILNVQNKKLSPVQSIFVGFWWLACHFDENCLTNLNLFSIKSQTIVTQTATILVFIIEFPRQNWTGWMIHRLICWGGGCIFTALHMTVYQKRVYRWTWQIWPRTGGHLVENINCIKTRDYLANIRIARHSQDKCQE